MKWTFNLNIIFLLFFILASNSFAVSQSFIESKIQKEIKKLNLENIHLGIAVERTKSGQMLFTHYAERSYIPASNNKIFTAIAALFTLDKNFRFKTQIYANETNLNSVKNGQFNGNLYLKFSGDPTLTTTRLTNLIEGLKKKGIRSVSGNVYIIANDFTGPYYPMGWNHSDMNYCYAPPVSTVNLNRNCFVIELKKNGKQTTLKRITNTQFMSIDNSTYLADYNELKKCQFDLVLSPDNHVELKGCLPDQLEWQFSFAVRNPALKLKESLPSMFQDAGISFNANVNFGSLPQGLTLIAQTQSESLYPMLEHMLLHSDNLYAETFARVVGLKVIGKGTVKAGTTAIQSVLENKLKVNTKSLQMEDGSGLSELDLTTPEFLVDVLTKTYYSSIGKTFYQILPTSGKTGTLAYRMGTDGLLGRVHAKTGTLDGNSTLSGYVLTKNVHRLTFSIMVNGLKENQRRNARKLQDYIVKVLYQYL